MRDLSLALALALLTVRAWGQSASPPGVEPTFSPQIDAMCPDAVREAKDSRSRMKAPAQLAPPTRPALRENLLLMARQDQEVRAAMTTASLTVDLTSPEIARMIEVDSANLKRLKHIVAQDGFPTARMVGYDGVKAAWLLVLHAMNGADFQEEVLRLTTGHVLRGEVSGNDVAMLTDGLLSGRGKPQRYGSNFVVRDGEWMPSPIEDEANVERRRRAAGLGTLANYACVLRAMYGAPKPPEAN